MKKIQNLSNDTKNEKTIEQNFMFKPEIFKFNSKIRNLYL